jgi:hypothetical protein
MEEAIKCEGARREALEQAKAGTGTLFGRE